MTLIIFCFLKLNDYFQLETKKINAKSDLKGSQF